MHDFAIMLLVFVINGQICYWVGVYMGERRWTKKASRTIADNKQAYEQEMYDPSLRITDENI